jgi:hypothetical protein
MRYRTKADVQAAKEAWEERGKILWPDDLKPKRSAIRAPIRVRTSGAQVEMRL